LWSGLTEEHFQEIGKVDVEIDVFRIEDKG
jgi:hypothetical protein